MNESKNLVRVPLGARVIAVIDGLIATSGLICAIDVPEIGLVVATATLPAAWGLFRGSSWGWRWGFWLHVAIVALGLLAYVAMTVEIVADMDRPRGHMELWGPSKGTLVVLSIVLVVYLLMTVAPVVYLLRKSVRESWASKRHLDGMSNPQH